MNLFCLNKFYDNEEIVVVVEYKHLYTHRHTHRFKEKLAALNWKQQQQQYSTVIAMNKRIKTLVIFYAQKMLKTICYF